MLKREESLLYLSQPSFIPVVALIWIFLCWKTNGNAYCTFLTSPFWATQFLFKKTKLIDNFFIEESNY